MNPVTTQFRRLLAIMFLVNVAVCPAFVPRIDPTTGGVTLWNLNRLDPTIDPPPDQNPSTLAIRFRIDPRGSGRGNTAEEITAIRAAFGQWQAIAGSRLRFEEASVPNPAALPSTFQNDGINSIFWASAGSGLISPGALARSFITTVDATIVEADIVLNRDIPWSTSYESVGANDYFLENVVLHEIGHFLGTLHSPLGAAAMFWRLAPGPGAAAGLSTDEISFAQSHYATAAMATTRGTLTGVIRIGNQPTAGAIVSAHDPAGNAIAASVSDAKGTYRLPGLPPNTYELQIQGLDPDSQYLVRGLNLDEFDNVFGGKSPLFLPTRLAPANLGARTQTLNATVPAGSMPFRVVEMRTSLLPERRSSGDSPVTVSPGESGGWLGVFVAGTPASAELSVIGGGITFGTVEIVPNALPGLALVQAPITVVGSTAAGMRTIVLRANGSVATAAGFLRIAPSVPDFNFDGFDDRFQRRYFFPFTRAEAAPALDPDGDKWSNAKEFTGGSDPTDPLSYHFKILSISRGTETPTVVWQTTPGRRFQLSRRGAIPGDGWMPIGHAQLAGGETLSAQDTTPGERIRTYRVQCLP